MKILVVGSGGREHALAWKISQSPRLDALYCAPGNPGTKSLGENVAIDPVDVAGLTEFAQDEKIDLTVVGPEMPLTLGIVDAFKEKKLRIFGPDKAAAELEGSKIFAKRFMERHRIPTGSFKIADTAESALKILKSGAFDYPVVVKADGLAAGKGVIVCPDADKAEKAVRDIMVEKAFGDAGNRLLIEEFLTGKEASFIVISDGTKVAPLATTMDHKAVYDGDKGPNTGGMGAISPSPFIDAGTYDEIMQTIVFPTISRMNEEGHRFEGVLYVGLMLTDKGPKVLEYNCRFGDPETQPQMLRLESDLVDLFTTALDGDVLREEARWSSKPSACVIMASGGYPGAYQKNKRIDGLIKAMKVPGITIFHAGTKLVGGAYYTNGGRVLGVCGTAETLADTMSRIYEAVSLIEFEKAHFRKDIGAARKETG